MSEWISVKDNPPPFRKGREVPFVLAYNTQKGIGVAWFWRDNECDLEPEDIEAGYLCSCQFIKNIPDGNYCIDTEDIDIFDNDPFHNLGTVTHWKPLPIFKDPEEKA